MAGDTTSMTGSRRPGAARALAAVLAVGAALALAGCGGGDAAGAGGAEGTTSAFCEAFGGYEQRFSRGASHAEVLAALRALDPPPEIAGDVETLTEVVEDMTTVDTSDPEAVAEFQAGPTAEAERASGRILDYVANECPAGRAGAEVVLSEPGG